MTKQRAPANTLSKGRYPRFCAVCCSYTDARGICPCNAEPVIVERDPGDEDEGDDADE